MELFVIVLFVVFFTTCDEASSLMYIRVGEFQDPNCKYEVKPYEENFMTEGVCDNDDGGGLYFGYYYDIKNDSIWYYQYCDSNCRTNCELIYNRKNGQCIQVGNNYEIWEYTKLFKKPEDVYAYYFISNDYDCRLNHTKYVQWTPGGECSKISNCAITQKEYWGNQRCQGEDLVFEIYDNSDCKGKVYGNLLDTQKCIMGDETTLWSCKTR